MKILVTGSSGQIGTNLALRLANDGKRLCTKSVYRPRSCNAKRGFFVLLMMKLAADSALNIGAQIVIKPS